MSSLRNKSVIVTGAASGIGRATVIRLVSEGANALGVDLNAAGLAETMTLAQTAAASDLAENHHFQEHLTEQGIEFDYLLCPGPASTRTAIRILEQEHYPPNLLDRARQLLGP